MLRTLLIMLLALIVVSSGYCEENQKNMNRLVPPAVEHTKRLADSDENILNYFQDLKMIIEDTRQIKDLIIQLGSDKFTEREDASRRLIPLAKLAKIEIGKASCSNDLEIARRAKRVFADYQVRSNSSEAILLASLREVERRKLPGVLPCLVDTLPFCDRPDIRQAAERALMAVAHPKDAEYLSRALRSPYAPVRITALKVYGMFTGEAATEELARMLDDENEEVRLFAAVILLQRDDRRSLCTLGQLLESSELWVRTRASRILKAVTHQDFGFVAFESCKIRAKSTAEWQRWIRHRGKNARLILPIPTDTRLGKVLLCSHLDRLVELDDRGKEIWAIHYHQPCCCEGQPNGHRVVGSGNKRIDEYDADGKLVWFLDRLPYGVKHVHRLSSGNTLVVYNTGQGWDLIQEFRPDKRICWESSFKSLSDIQRLGDDHTIIASWYAGKVVEFDLHGEVVWTMDKVDMPSSVQRLENGNTLISLQLSNKVIEADHAGRIVWSHSITNPYQAQRLVNGHTVIFVYDKILEIDAYGYLVWQTTVKGVCHMSAY